MTTTSPDTEDDKPLDPALLRVQARLRRLMLIAGLTLGVGLLAVFGAVLYRIVGRDATPVKVTEPAAAPEPFALTVPADKLALPSDALLISSTLDGNRLALTYAHDRGYTVVVVDTGSGDIVGRVELSGN